MGLTTLGQVLDHSIPMRFISWPNKTALTRIMLQEIMTAIITVAIIIIVVEAVVIITMRRLPRPHPR